MNFRDMVDALVHRVHDDYERGTSAELIIRVPRGIKLSEQLIEGQWKQHDSQYKIRLDKRPSNQGGDQIHVQKRDGSEWAYRETGERSEPHKYKLPATRAVQDIVRSVFGLSPDHIIEVSVIQANRQHCLVEVAFSA